MTGEFEGTARELLTTLLTLEREHGRERPHPGAARTLDLDLIFFGDLVWTSPGSPFRIRGSASGDSCSSRWPRWRPTGAIR